MSKQIISSLYSMNQKRVAAGPSIVSVKWHNGFYLTPLNIAWASQLAQVDFAPCLNGLQVRKTWRQLEGPTAGDYTAGFADIDSKLNDLTTGGRNKRLVILLEHKTIHDTDKTLAADVTPDYANTSAYGGGWLYTDSNNSTKPLAGGKIIKMFNANIRNRLAVLAAAYGAKYNNHPNFEGIGIIESAVPTLIGTSGVDYPVDSEDQYAIGIYMWIQALKSAFPNTMVYQFCNYLRPTVKTMIDGGTFGAGGTSLTVPGYIQDAIAIGCPNVLINEYGLGGVDSTKTPSTPQPPNVGIFNHFRANAGSVPILPSWQRPDFIKTTLVTSSPAGHVPTIQELYDFTKNSLGANYIFVTPATATAADPVDHWADFKAWLNANPAIRDSLTGGLNSAKPSKYAGIITT